MFSKLNEMIPGPQPDCLKDLNEIEKGAVRLIIPYVTMFENKAGGQGYSGHSISFDQEIASFAQTLPTSLPRPIEDLQIILIKTSKIKGDKGEFKASGSKIRAAMEWLIATAQRTEVQHRGYLSHSRNFDHLIKCLKLPLFF